MKKNDGEAFLENAPHSRTNPWPILFGVLGIFGVLLLDVLTGREVSFAIFYLGPISWVAWFGNTRLAIWTALLSGLCWYCADIWTGNAYSHPLIPLWNAVMRTLIFLIVAGTLSRLKATGISERKAKEQALEATRAKSDFLANMSHEIRAPLNALIGSADLLSETRLTREQAEYVEILKVECEQARRLLNDILDYSKIEAHRIQLEEASFSLRKLVASACQSLEASARAKNLDLKWSIDPSLEDHRKGDPHRLRQVFTNLLNNAVKFTETGSVTFRAKPKHGSIIHFEIQDTGIGIPDDQKDLLFGRFTQASGSVSRRFGGSGLGLSIAKGLIEAMGGTIEFKSVEKIGTTFFFDVPLASLPGGAAGAAEIQTRPLEFQKPQKSLRVLLVDDYDFNRRIISRFLSHPSVSLELAENGRVGLEKILAGAFDLVLLDMHMPEMDGWTVAREIRKWERNRNEERALPIIALTASALKEDEDKCLAAGCTAFLGKPIRKIDLIAGIERVLKVDLSTSEPSEPSSPIPAVDPEFAVLIPGFLEEASQRCESLLEQAGASDFDAAAETVHKLIGLGGSYGFDRISEIARDIEQAVNSRNASGISHLAGELKSYIYRLKGNL